ncbi:hypothetical protein P0136_11990 [Lentisphaerota bacterium ZTH]|nr:hypothetical protein JYG24_10500 [Lentisphaerota bacterium]WET06078.1 hypothetical protein P0136_11990 [Lentisphaerota bacterium ZTH]
MRKSLYVSFFFVLVFLTSFISKAAECAICGQECKKDERHATDRIEFEFRKEYFDHLKEYINLTHSQLIENNKFYTLDLLCELFLIPPRQGLYKDDNFLTFFKKIEDAFQAEKLRQSIGDILSYDKMRQDIKDTLTNLQLNNDRTEFECPLDNFLDLDKIVICNECSLSRLSMFYDHIDEHAVKMPINIQLALRLDKIINNSDIVIVLGSRESADNLLLSYLKLFNNKRFVLGLDAYDDSPDWSNPKFGKEICQAVHETINKQCDDGFPIELSRLITEFGFPILTFEKYYPNRTRFKRALFRDDLPAASVRSNLVSFLEARCPNAVCFGFSTALTHLLYLADYNKAVKDNYELIKKVYGGAGQRPPSLKEIILWDKLRKFGAQHNLSLSKVVRLEMVEKICRYFNAINKGEIPFVILVDRAYGLWFDPMDYHIALNAYSKTKNQLLIQNLIKEKLGHRKKVTTIYVNKGPAAIFSKEKNDFLSNFCLDYVISVNSRHDM